MIGYYQGKPIQGAYFNGRQVGNSLNNNQSNSEYRDYDTDK